MGGVHRGAPGIAGCVPHPHRRDDCAEPAARDEAATRLDATLEVLLTELSPSKAALLAARLTGARRNDAYARALELAGAPRG